MSTAARARRRIAALLAAGVALVGLGAAAAPAASAADRPNVIVIMTDDQEVSSVEHMPNVKKLRQRGVDFARHTASFSLCCPSRSTYFLGQFAHNHNVRGNFAPIGGYGVFNKDETIQVWLQRAGYATGHIGKYINGYDQTSDPETKGVPKGWTDWHGGVDPTTYLFHDYLLNDNGQITLYGTGPGNYQTDVLTQKAVDIIERRAKASEPFFLNLAYLAPHWEVRPDYATIGGAGDLEGLTPNDTRLGIPPVPAERHAGLFPGIKAPRTPSFDQADVSDKPAFVQQWPRLDQAAQDQIDQWYGARIRSLQAVDEGVGRIVDALERTGELDNTYVVFTADNGWLQGEHRLPLKKVDVYDPSTRIPLVVSGPQVPRNATVRDWTSNVDLPATILELAKAPRPGATFPLDGAPLTPYLSDPARKTGRVVLHEAYDDNGKIDYQAVRAGRWKYVRYATGETELYDLQADPHELRNRHRDARFPKVRKELRRLLAQQAECRGDGCFVDGYSDYWDVNVRVDRLRLERVGPERSRVRVRARVTNTGKVDLRRVRIAARESTRDRASTRIDLAAGKSRTVSFEYRWTPSTAARTHAVVADPKRQLREATRKDNTASRKVRFR